MENYLIIVDFGLLPIVLLIEYMKVYYSNKIKIIPTWIEDYLSPIALAIWIMDDGGWIKNRGIKLSTNCFTLSDTKKLVYLL